MKIPYPVKVTLGRDITDEPAPGTSLVTMNQSGYIWTFYREPQRDAAERWIMQGSDTYYRWSWIMAHEFHPLVAITGKGD